MTDHFQEEKKLEINRKAFNHEGDFEILWSREKNIPGSYFIDDDSFSDLTERSASSCSWQNDEFDMKSSNKVTKSLEAVDDALYDKQLSPFISEEVYLECSHWSDRFIFLRLKGQAIEFNKDNADLDLNLKESFCPYKENSFLSLCLEGKKLPLHFAERTSKKTNCEGEMLSESFQTTTLPDSINENSSTKVEDSNTSILESETSFFITSIQEKVIEKLSQHIWPKVIEKLFKNSVEHKSDKFDEEFQLPPIVAAQVECKTYHPFQRPKTEETSSRMIDFPNLSTYLSVSPKILQDRKECRSSKNRSSRPNSEMHLSRKSTVLKSSQNRKNSHILSNIVRMPNTPKQIYFTSQQKNKPDEKDIKIPACLPALEEDITGYVGLSTEISSCSKTKTTPMTSQFPNKTKGFLPPINLPAKVTLSNDLLTFLESDLKCSRETKSKTLCSRPYTCASKKDRVTSGSLRYRFSENFFSGACKYYSEVDKYANHAEDQATLFPIVTSLVPSREKNFNAKKDLHSHTLNEKNS